MFSTDDFDSFKERVIPFAHITTRIEGDPDQSLLGEKGGRGFPTLQFLDARGWIIAKPNGRSVEAFASTLEEDVPAFFELEKQAGSDPDANREFFLKQIDFGNIEDFAAAYARLDEMKFEDEDEQRGHRNKLIQTEFSIASARWRAGEKEDAGARIRAMKDAGHIPVGQDLIRFWDTYGAQAVEAKNADQVQEAIDALEALDNRRAQRTIDGLKESLEKLKG